MICSYFLVNYTLWSWNTSVTRGISTMSSSEPFPICLCFLPYQCLTLWPVLAAFELLPLLRLLDKIGQTMRLFPKTHLLESQATRLQMQTHTMFRINKYLYSAIFSFRYKESSIQRNDKIQATATVLPVAWKKGSAVK